MSLPQTPRQYRQKSEQVRLAKEFRESGLTLAAFSKQHRVSPSTLVRWLAKARDASSTTPKPAKRGSPVVFREVLPASVSALPPITPAASWAVEITTADGVTLRCREMVPPEDLARLLRAARC